jgi:hypothetical protein
VAIRFLSRGREAIVASNTRCACASLISRAGRYPRPDPNRPSLMDRRDRSTRPPSCRPSCRRNGPLCGDGLRRLEKMAVKESSSIARRTAARSRSCRRAPSARALSGISSPVAACSGAAGVSRSSCPCAVESDTDAHGLDARVTLIRRTDLDLVRMSRSEIPPYLPIDGHRRGSRSSSVGPFAPVQEWQ